MCAVALLAEASIGLLNGAQNRVTALAIVVWFTTAGRADLLRSGGQLGAGTPMRMLDQSWKVEGWHLGIRIDVPTATDPVALRPDVIRGSMRRGISAHVVEQGAGWAAWTSFDESPLRATLQSRSATIRRVQWRLRSGMPSMMGVGSLQSGPNGLVRSLAEATETARIAVSRPAGGHLVQFDRLGLSRVHVSWTQTDTFGPVAASFLAPLQDQSGELVNALSACLGAESSVSEPAAILCVHRNTVSTRIAKAVQLACRAVLT